MVLESMYLHEMFGLCLDPECGYNMLTGPTSSGLTGCCRACPLSCCWSHTMQKTLPGALHTHTRPPHISRLEALLMLMMLYIGQTALLHACLFCLVIRVEQGGALTDVFHLRRPPPSPRSPWVGRQAPRSKDRLSTRGTTCKRRRARPWSTRSRQSLSSP